MAIYLNRKKLGQAYHDRISYCKGYLNRVLVFSCETEPIDPPEENILPTISDIELTVNGGTTTEIGITYFTEGAPPPYNDADGDLIHSVKVDGIHQDNTGIFYYKGYPVYQGLVITKADIEAGYLVHVGRDKNEYKTDILAFSVRDKESSPWVS